MTVDNYPLSFSPTKVGDLQLKHRYVLAPLTRCRSPGEVANKLNAEYYSQRSSEGGLLVSEGTTCSVTGAGYPNVPGILTAEQAAGWKLSTDAVHAKGGFIFAQLWHVGRVSNNEYQKNHEAPVSSSAVAAPDRVTPRALDQEGIDFTVSEYKLSAQRAREANFDGVEIHAAHGYLIDQFLQSSVNQRTDAYGGSVENRSRFLFQVLDAVLTELPATKVAIRLSPFLGIQGATSPDDEEELFRHVLGRLAGYKLAYVQLTEPKFGAWQDGGNHSDSKLNVFKGILQEPTKLMLTGGYLAESGETAIKEGRTDLVGVGRPFITNPDFVERVRLGKPLTPNADPKTYYASGAENYTSYKTWREDEKAVGTEVPGAGSTEAK
ncbi:hypothetical protein HKX48_005451 [Thoreauomyces humboldtii]|nr:hypothetical protein HKX48_005451 [Thoreauomyces humboldtii]